MSVVKKLAGETAIYGLSHMLAKALYFIVFTVYLTRKTSELEYGIYSDLYGYTTIFLTVLVFRLDTAFFRFGSGQQDRKLALSTIMLPMILGALLLILFGTVYDEHIARWLSYPQSSHYVRWFVWIFGFDAIASIVYAKLRLESRPYRFLFFKVVNIAVTVVLVLFFMEVVPRYYPTLYERLNGILGCTRLIDYVFFSNLIASGITLILMIREMPKRLTYDGALFKKMIWYATPLVVVALAGNINQSLSAPIQKYFLGNSITSNLAAAGIYSGAAKIAILLSLFTTAFNYAAEPFFFNNAHEDKERKAYGKVALAFTVFSVLVAIGISLYLDVIIYIIGERFRVSQAIVPILLYAYVLLGIYYNIGIWYKLSDKTYYGALISIIGAIITLVLNIALLPSIGSIASAYASVACYMAMLVLGYWLGQKHYPIRYPIRKMLAYVIIGMLVIGVFRYILHPMLSFWSYHVLATLTILVYLYYAYTRELPSLLKE